MHVVTYDLNAGWEMVKAAAEKRGFKSHLDGLYGGQAPNTTLFIEAPDTPSALTTFKKAVDDANLGKTLLGGGYIVIEKIYAARVEDGCFQ